MVSSPHQCPGVAGKVYNRFISDMDKDPHSVATIAELRYAVLMIGVVIV